MKLIVHGSDIQKSRDYLFTEKNKLKSYINLEGEGLSYDIFFQSAENKSLFDEDYIVIENLLVKSKASSPEFKKIIEYINNSRNINFVLWESQLLTKTQIGFLKQFEIKEFNIPKQLFIFLDNLKPENYKKLIFLYHELRISEEAEFIFFMIIRQFRILLQLSDNYTNKIDEVSRMAEWQITKLKLQARQFKNIEILNNYNKLFEMETNYKTGKSGMPLDTSIDFFLSGL